MKFIFWAITMAVALWVFFDSQKHGYSVAKGLLWAVGVFFVLVLFLPLYLIARNKKKRIAATVRQNPPVMNTCFYCRQGYEGNPSACPQCGQRLQG